MRNIVPRSKTVFNDTLPVKEDQRKKTFCSVIVQSILTVFSFQQQHRTKNLMMMMCMDQNYHHT